MKPVAANPDPAVRLGQVTDLLPRRRPIATMSVLAVTTVVTVLQFPFPAVRLALWRDPDALAAGQWWRLVTALFVQNDAWWQILIVFAMIAGIGVIAERARPLAAALRRLRRGRPSLRVPLAAVRRRRLGGWCRPARRGMRLAAVAGRAAPGPCPDLGGGLAAGRPGAHRGR